MTEGEAEHREIPWYEVALVVPEAQEEQALADLLAAFPQGILEEKLARGLIRMVGYSAGPPGEDVWWRIRRIGPVALQVGRLPETDFFRRFRELARRKEVVPGLTVAPTAEEWQEGDLLVEPGPAFGTGDHPTTRLALLGIQRFVRPGIRAADVGTGSGILALALKRLGADEVVAYDVDPLAVKTALGHAERNGLAVTVRLGTLSPEDGPFHLVVANIVADVHLSLRHVYRAALAEGGVLVLSGVSRVRRHEVVAGFADAFALLWEAAEGEWCALALRLREAAPPGRGEGRAGTE